jgi:hypothetical protein
MFVGMVWCWTSLFIFSPWNLIPCLTPDLRITQRHHEGISSWHFLNQLAKTSAIFILHPRKILNVAGCNPFLRLLPHKSIIIIDQIPVLMANLGKPSLIWKYTFGLFSAVFFWLLCVAVTISNVANCFTSICFHLISHKLSSSSNSFKLDFKNIKFL